MSSIEAWFLSGTASKFQIAFKSGRIWELFNVVPFEVESEHFFRSSSLNSPVGQAAHALACACSVSSVLSSSM
jgi:hypothetical protein